MKHVANFLWFLGYLAIMASGLWALHRANGWAVEFYSERPMRKYECRRHGLHSDGNDEITAGTGRDVIDGGKGNDYIHGGTGDDKIVGATETMSCCAVDSKIGKLPAGKFS